MYTPDSVINLCCVPFDKSLKNVVRFGSVQAQTNYFLNTVRHSYNTCTYVRKDDKIYIDDILENLFDCNYIMYKNTHFSNRWFFAFINKMEYADDGCTVIYCETDVYQTWLFDISFKSSFVIREMVTDDTIGANLIEEKLETGEYITDGANGTGLTSELWVIVGVSAVIEDGQAKACVGNVYGGIYSGLRYFAFPIKNSAGFFDATAINNFVKSYATAAASSSIVTMFMLPKFCLPSGTISGGEVTQLGSGANSQFLNSPVTLPSAIDGYTPKNNKLFTYPYCFMHVSNNSGQGNDFKYEYFSTAPTFELSGECAPSSTLMLSPCNYKGVNTNYNECVTLSGYPLCSWTENSYANWLAQNSVSIPLGVLNAVSGTAISIATGNPVAGASGLLAVAGEMAQIYQHSLQPSQIRGSTNSANLNVAKGIQDFYIYNVHIKQQYAKIIDQYFDMFGYKVNTVKVPNLSTRPCWNYVKTIDINITGDIPDNDLEKIKQAFNSGITLWSASANFLDYSQNNH